MLTTCFTVYQTKNKKKLIQALTHILMSAYNLHTYYYKKNR